jgi:hypothetical protein
MAAEIEEAALKLGQETKVIRDIAKAADELMGRITGEYSQSKYLNKPKQYILPDIAPFAFAFDQAHRQLIADERRLYVKIGELMPPAGSDEARKAVSQEYIDTITPLSQELRDKTYGMLFAIFVHLSDGEFKEQAIGLLEQMGWKKPQSPKTRSRRKPPAPKR